MNNNSIKYTSFALSILSKLLGSNFQVHGVEKYQKNLYYLFQIILPEVKLFLYRILLILGQKDMSDV